jgi:predicted outer membrane protein
MTRNRFLVIAVAAVMIVGCNRHRETRTENEQTGAIGTAGSDRNNVAHTDKDFVHDTAMADISLIELGTMAAEHAADDQVKEFGQLMNDAHTPAANQLKAIAAENSIEWPSELDHKYRDERDNLMGQQGADFDRKYISFTVDTHKDLVDKLESRVDKKNLSQWKADYDDRAAGRSVSPRGAELAIIPAASDNPVTMKINAWAAAVYPSEYAHLVSARAIDTALKARPTN